MISDPFGFSMVSPGARFTPPPDNHVRPVSAIPQPDGRSVKPTAGRVLGDFMGRAQERRHGFAGAPVLQTTRTISNVIVVKLPISLNNYT